MVSGQVNYITLIEKIIKEQEQVIGPLAYDIAKKVNGLAITNDHVTLQGDPIQTVEQLVVQYSGLFGQASVEVSKNALKSMEISGDELPAILK